MLDKDEIIKITAALRTGEFQIILQDLENPKKDKKLIYNGFSGITQNEKPIIYLVEK